MMRTLLGRIAIFLTTAVTYGCANAGEDRVLGIEATGTVTGVVYFDANATRQLEDEDELFDGVRIGLVVAGSGDTVAFATSRDGGVFNIAGVAVGDYRVAVDTTTVGDSAFVASVDPANITVRPADTVSIEVAISFPLVTVAEALALPIGTNVFVDGIALNARETFGDSTIHVADTSGALRAIRAGPSAVFPGDSIRLRGTMATRDGRVVLNLDRRAPSVLAIAELPAPDTVTTAVAGAAGAGVLDAGFVRIDSARITDTTTAAGDFVVTVNDGSGPLAVLFDQDVAFIPEQFLVPGADLAVSGLLVVAGPGVWQLKPRSDADVDVTVPVISVAEARMSSVGDLVFVDGVALNDLAAFADSTLHIADTSGAIRATRVRPANILPGDSVRLIGTIANRDGEPVIDLPRAFLLAVSRVPPAQRVTSMTAGNGGGGTLDAALVRVPNATISSTATVAGDFVLTVDDGSGVLEVVLDVDIGFFLVPLVPSVVIDVTGVLVPTGSGAWQLKPRNGGDVVIN